MNTLAVQMNKERLGIQSVEVGFALLDTLARVSAPDVEAELFGDQ